MAAFYTIFFASVLGFILYAFVIRKILFAPVWVFISLNTVMSTTTYLSYAPHLMFFYLCSWLMLLWLLAYLIY